MQDENQTSEELAQETQEEQEAPEVVEFSWDEAQEVLALREELYRTQQTFSNFLFETEKRKTALMSRFEMVEKEMYMSAQALQQKHNISSEYTYEIKLPTKEGEKGYFVRKDD